MPPRSITPRPCPDPPRPPLERHGDCERLIAASGVEIVFGGDAAYYNPRADKVHMPRPEQFSGPEAYYATAFHEIAHATGHESRLNRPLLSRFGSEAYAFEELIAETASAFCCAATGVTPEPRPDHAQYLNNWLAVLRGDTRAVFTAFARAQAAADFILEPPQPVRPAQCPAAPRSAPPTRPT